MSDQDWFAPKRFGYGAGLPIAWQGWAALGLYIIIVVPSAMILVPHHPAIAVVILGLATGVFSLIAARHTRGGWKWRWNRGEDE